MPNFRPFLFAALAIQLIIPLPVSAASDCPVINGRFYKDYTKDGEELRSFSPIYTRVIDGLYHYRFRTADPDYRPADGKWRPVTVGSATGFVKVTCGSNLITFEVRNVEATFHSYKSYRPLDRFRVQIESNLDAVNGVFVREE